MKKKNYLKYFRVIRRFIQAKYSINLPDLEILLYLYSEEYFSEKVFVDWGQIMSWEKNRMQRMIDEGWIQVFRAKTKRRKAMYSLTLKAKKMVSTFYKTIEGETITENPNYNPLFKKDAKFSDKVYKPLIRKMNKAIRQPQRPFQ